MKILHTCEFYFPSIGGAQEAVRQISEELVKLGHEVTVATSKLENRKFKKLHGVTIKEFAIRGNKIKGIKGEKAKYKRFILNSNFDLILNYAAQQWTSDLFFEIINQVKAKKVFVPCGFSGLKNPNYAAYFQKMPSILKKYDALVFLSKKTQDYLFAKKYKLKNVQIIPNGASFSEFEKKTDIDTYKLLNLRRQNFLVLNVASFTGSKGQIEAMKIFHKSKIHQAAFLLIGDYVNKTYYRNCFLLAKFLNLINFSKKKKIIIWQANRQKILAAFKAADLFLFTSNIECSPLVIFEALASKTPFLSTSVGNVREIKCWTNGGIILPTYKDKSGYSHAKIKESAKILTKVYNNKKLRQKLTENGYNLWRAKFTWEKIAKQYEALYLSLLTK